MKKNLDLVYLAFVFAMLIAAGVLLFHNSAWATPLFVFAMFLGLMGMWVEARGWEMLFEFITGHLPKLPKKGE